MVFTCLFSVIFLRKLIKRIKIKYINSAMHKTTSMFNEERSEQMSDDDSANEERIKIKRRMCEDNELSESETELSKKIQPTNGKKTKGRVKIKMEFIDNKLRRYTTFSKRKTGIMKKAYELSTLTGTQVMVLVASETGHVYTFATRKLQPMITSEAGKALIQTCLNSPDPPVGPSASTPDQRMSAAGYEETELSYNIEDGDNKPDVKTLFVNQDGSATLSGTNTVQSIAVSPTVGGPITSLPSPLPSNLTAIPLLAGATTALGTNGNNNTKVSGTPAISMQLPQGTGFTTILAPGGALPQGSTLHIGTLQSAAQNQLSNNQSPVSSQNQSPLFRISPAAIVSLSGTSTPNTPTQNSISSTQSNISVVSGNVVIPTSSISSNSSTAVPGTVMYQTAQGIVYAASSPTSLSDRVILNLGQSPTLSLQPDQSGTQQIYIPVSLTPAHQKVSGTLAAKVAVSNVTPSSVVQNRQQKCRK
ncbi:serum response factor-like isoform X1 [Centruroides sculpturatus]|uniref:serum response factor-like isoform X1 n=1 Tax=Centruroides sculpturatus TaxID=218467 RepID=UPI000C6CB3D2|nr:serum response factor-like isoform X1 [Centruroides sculpturatus]